MSTTFPPAWTLARSTSSVRTRSCPGFSGAPNVGKLKSSPIRAVGISRRPHWERRNLIGNPPLSLDRAKAGQFWYLEQPLVGAAVRVKIGVGFVDQRLFFREQIRLF